MGEYAKYNGESIKIGTCEDMYYLRADQAEMVLPEQGSVDPIGDSDSIRFRFPFPEEDNVKPGEFDEYRKGLAVWGAEAPEGVEHGIVQFVASQGYNVCLPCPESKEPATHGLRVHRNGFGGAVRIAQQRVWNGHLAVVCKCGGCGYAWRLPELEDAALLIAQCRSEADKATREDAPTRATYWHEIASRITAGYLNPPAWVAARTCV